MRRCAVLFDRAIYHFRLRTNLRRATESSTARHCVPVQPDAPGQHSLDCSMAVEANPGGEPVFTLKIRGRICTDQAGRRVYLRAKFDDVTDSPGRAAPVYITPAQAGMPPSKQFEYVCDLGRLNSDRTEISSWMSVGRISPAQMVFGRRGKRLLRLRGSVLCYETRGELAACTCQFQYDNNEYGYLDLAENGQRSNALAVTLAFSLSAADGRMYKCEIDKIKQWAHSNIGDESSKSTRRQLHRALRKTIGFFKTGHKIDAAALAAQLAQIAPAAQRYDIVEMCLNVVGSKGFVSPGQIEMLKKLSRRLDIEPDRFRDMLQRLAPADTHQVKDMELIFGLSTQMTREQARETLNNEYRKWNARVTCMDPTVQNQAEQMLQLIAEARGRQAV